MRQARPFPVLALALAMVMSLFSMIPTVAQDDDVACADFDAWPWAQTVLESDPDRYAGALDPDGNGVACEDLTIHGFAPVLWTDRMPDDVEAAQVVSVTDGDTFKVSINGQVDTVRMYHIDTPETSDPYRGKQCGGDEASGYLSWVFSLIPDGTVYLEYDQTERDRYDRRLAYVWVEIGGDIYMVNEAMVRNGWAESETYKPDTKYKEQLDAAEQCSVDKVNGVRLKCGKFGQPNDGTAGPSDEQLRQAMNKQPHQGQFAGFLPSAPTRPDPAPAAPAPDSAEVAGAAPAPAEFLPVDTSPAEAPPVEAPPADAPPVEAPPVEEPPVEEPPVGEPPVEEPPVEAPPPVAEEPAPPPVEAPAPPVAEECDPSYPDFCLAPSWVIGDLDCGDIPYTWFTVYPPDSHGFDGDGDGIGCER